MKKINEKGITLIALIVTIIILFIIAGIAVYNGTKTIKEAKLEEIRTNMLLIEVKARGLVEETNFQLGPDQQNNDELEEIRKAEYEDKNKLQKLSNATDVNIPSGSDIPSDDSAYVVTEDTFSLWGLDKVYESLDGEENYIIAFDEGQATVEIYNTLGYNGAYSLTDIDKIN